MNRQLPLPFQNVGAIQPDLAEDFAGVQPLVGGEQNQIAFLDFQFRRQRGLFRVAEKFHDGRFPFAAFDLDVSQPFRAETLGVFGHRLNLALRRAGQPFRVDRLHHAAGGDRAAEHLELAGAEFLREIHQLHAEPRVRLVNAAAVQRFLEADALERRRHVHVQRGFPDALRANPR